ncbi:MAG: hypothetical protein Q9172_006331 [Xanthocarpia lactea]
MHFSTTSLALALSLVPGAFSRPQPHEGNEQTATSNAMPSNDAYGGNMPTATGDSGPWTTGYGGDEPTTTGDTGYEPPEITGSPDPNASGIPEQCMMFKPYVAPVFLEVVCSMHMTPLAPGSMPTFPTSCFSSAIGEQTDIYGDGPEASLSGNVPEPTGIDEDEDEGQNTSVPEGSTTTQTSGTSEEATATGTGSGSASTMVLY